MTCFSFLPAEMPSDCHELFLRGGATSGVYVIQPQDSEPFKVFCEMIAGRVSALKSCLMRPMELRPADSPFHQFLCTDGGWTVIQRRRDGSVNFDQGWEAYEDGFGNLNGKHALDTFLIVQTRRGSVC